MSDSNERARREAQAIEAASRALEPIGRALGKAIERGTDVVVDVLRWGGATFGQIAEVSAALLTDPLYAWQCGNRVRLLEKLKRLQLPPGAVPRGWAAKVLVGAQDTDEDELLDLWARLLAAGQIENARHPGFVQALRGMSAADAAALRRFLDEHGEYRNFPAAASTPDVPADCQHLVALGVMSWRVEPEVHYNGESTDRYGSYGPSVDLTWVAVLEITQFGTDLSRALELLALKPAS